MMWPSGRIKSNSNLPKPEAEDGVELIELDTGRHFIKNGGWKMQLQSKPPKGGKRVTNLWITPEGKLMVEYEDTPE